MERFNIEDELDLADFTFKYFQENLGWWDCYVIKKHFEDLHGNQTRDIHLKFIKILARLADDGLLKTRVEGGTSYYPTSLMDKYNNYSEFLIEKREEKRQNNLKLQRKDELSERNTNAFEVIGSRVGQLEKTVTDYSEWKKFVSIEVGNQIKADRRIGTRRWWIDLTIKVIPILLSLIAIWRTLK